MQRRSILRSTLAAVFLIAGAVHFARPDIYLPIMPRFLPRPLDLIYISGACEFAGGAALLIPPLRRPASYGLIALLIAVFPANVQMAVNGFERGSPWWTLALLIARLPLQPILIVLSYLAGRDSTAPQPTTPKTAEQQPAR